MNPYTVYMHTTPNGKKYIGITSNDVLRRWGANGIGYTKQLFGRAIRKYGWDNIKHEILYTDLTREEAKAIEIELIAKYQTNNPKFGYNQTVGGDNTRKGVEKSQKEKNRLSQRWRGNKNPNAKPVICLETLIIYDTATEAKSKTGASKICDCCKRAGKHNKSGGYHWSYYDESKPLSDYWILLGKYLWEESQPRPISEEQIRKTIERSSKPVICLDTGIIYSSIREASKATGCHSSDICYCCKGQNKPSKGFHWKYI